jgi:phospholipid/cholesterol/gamma-HCH transport system substrate-binding protein
MTYGRGFKLKAFGVVVFVAGFIAVVLQLFVYAGGNLVPRHRYEVQAVVPSALFLAPHADVREAGVKVGKVEKIAVRGDAAVLLLQLDGDHAPVYRNARVLVRTKGQAGGSDYVALVPGTPAAGHVPSGGVLTIDHSSESTQFDQIISTLDPRTRRRLQRLLDNLSASVGRHGGDLNRFMGGAAALTRNSLPVNEVLNADRAQVVSLIDDFAHVMRAFGDRADAVRMFTVRAKTLAEAVAARDRWLRDTLAALPGFLQQTRATTTRLGAFAGSATPVMRNMRIATEDLVPATTLLRPASVVGRRAMRALSAFARRAAPMSRDLRPFSNASSRLAPPLESFLRQMNPLAAYLAPYARDTGALLANLKSATQTYDALGHYARVLGMQSKSNLIGVFTPEQEAMYERLVKSGILRVIDTRELNPYPKPGGAENTQPFSGTYPRLYEDPPYTATARQARSGRSPIQ